MIDARRREMDPFEKLDQDYERDCGPQPCDKYDRYGLPLTLGEWCRRFQDFAYRRIAEDWIGEIRISTIWLGTDHSFGCGPPLIFETMIFGGPEAIDGEMWRYATEEEARAGHARAVELVKAKK